MSALSEKQTMLVHGEKVTGDKTSIKTCIDYLSNCFFRRYYKGEVLDQLMEL